MTDKKPAGIRERLTKQDEDRRTKISKVPHWDPPEILLTRLKATALRQILRIISSGPPDWLEDGEPLSEEMIFFVELAARSITDPEQNNRPFNDKSGRQWLAGIDPEAFKILNDDLLEMHRMADDEGESTAKKN